MHSLPLRLVSWPRPMSGPMADSEASSAGTTVSSQTENGRITAAPTYTAKPDPLLLLSSSPPPPHASLPSFRSLASLALLPFLLLTSLRALPLLLLLLLGSRSLSALSPPLLSSLSLPLSESSLLRASLPPSSLLPASSPPPPPRTEQRVALAATAPAPPSPARPIRSVRPCKINDKKPQLRTNCRRNLGFVFDSAATSQCPHHRRSQYQYQHHRRSQY
eukprot:2196855-Rhodomonas_salina.3